MTKFFSVLQSRINRALTLTDVFKLLLILLDILITSEILEIFSAFNSSFLRLICVATAVLCRQNNYMYRQNRYM